VDDWGARAVASAQVVVQHANLTARETVRNGKKPDEKGRGLEPCFERRMPAQPLAGKRGSADHGFTVIGEEKGNRGQSTSGTSVDKRQGDQLTAGHGRDKGPRRQGGEETRGTWGQGKGTKDAWAR